MAALSGVLGSGERGVGYTPSSLGCCVYRKEMLAAGPAPAKQRTAPPLGLCPPTSQLQ